MSRAMVTGGAGFIGSHIVDHLLADGYRVCVVDDLSTGSVHNVAAGAALHQVDVRDLGSLRSVMESFKPEVVFHAAAQMDVRRSIREPVAAGTRRIVYASTAAVYGNPARLPVVETDPTHPISEYGASKLAFEHYLGAYAARGQIEYAVLRYPNVYGPRQRPNGEAGVVAIFTRQMLRGECVTIFW